MRINGTDHNTACGALGCGHSWIKHTLSMLVIAAFGNGGALQAQTPSVATDHSAYLPNETIVVDFSGGPGNKKDWIGIYPEGIIPSGTPPSTIWAYVDDTQNGAQGLANGTITFTQGLTQPGNWIAYFLLNDGYQQLAQTNFTVLDLGMPYVRADKRSYAPNEAIHIGFTNGPANPTDWIGIYPEGIIPSGSPPATFWFYVNGTQTATTGQSEGLINFTNGLQASGHYNAFLLENDGYTILATEHFSVALPVTANPRLLTIYPSNNSSNLPPVLEVMATITNNVNKVATNSVELRIDSTLVTPLLTLQNDLVTIAYTNATLLPSASTHTYQLTYLDNASPAKAYTNQGAFKVTSYQNILLPAPLYFENFDTTPEGQLPTGWTQTNFTDVSQSDPNIDFGNLDSAAYAGWTVVNVDRFQTPFVTYSDPSRATDDYLRVLSVNPRNVVNGQFIRNLASGRLAFGDSGYRNGQSQVMYLFTKDFDLSGKSNVYVSYHSLWEQNQDSIGAVEYSIDQGLTWLPIVYMLVTSDILTNAAGQIDATATFSATYSDVASYTDPNTGEVIGGNYGAFIGVAANLWDTLAPYISPRLDDNPSESKRVEIFRLPQADLQPRVRFRFAHAGTDSWYFGLDDFGLYTIPPTQLSLSIAIGNGTANLSWNGGAGIRLQTASNLMSPQWQDVANTLGASSASVALTERAGFYRLIEEWAKGDN